MANLTPCPHCGADIELDSAFCDQCGTALLKCPKCGQFRKGKFCPTCGVPTAPAGSAQPAQPQQPVQSQQPQQQQPPQQPRQPVQPVQPVQPIQPVQPVQPIQPAQQQQATGTALPPSDNQPTSLRADALGIVLPLQPGAVIGRTQGAYIAQLCNLQFISGIHARIDRNSSLQWSITDIGSRNGTTVNDIQCQPNVPVPIKIGDRVKFARTYTFYVQ